MSLRKKLFASWDRARFDDRFASPLSRDHVVDERSFEAAGQDGREPAPRAWLELK